MIKILSLKIVSTQWFNLNNDWSDSIDFNLYNLIIPNAINVEQDTTIRLSLEIAYLLLNLYWKQKLKKIKCIRREQINTNNINELDEESLFESKWRAKYNRCCKLQK